MATLKEALESVADKTRRHIVNISGGKDSAALAVYLKDQYPAIPAEYLFCDTGCELPETYEYIDRLEAYLGKKITRVNGLSLLGVEEKHGRTAFDYWLKEVYSGFLPNPQARWCTRVLKIKPFEQFIGDSKAYSYIGIRHDEDRLGYVGKKPPVISEKPNIEPVYPLKDDRIGLDDVRQILDDSGLGLPKYYAWRSRSGCYFCFYQQIGEWQGLKREHPTLFEQAKGYEKSAKDNRYTWTRGRALEMIETLEEEHNISQNEGCAVCHL